MKEKKLSRLLRGTMELWGFDVSQIESPEVSPGVPDLNYCINGKEGWIELKTVRRGEAPTIRLKQRRWITVRTAAGGNVWLMCHQESTDTIFLVRGRHVAQLHTLNDWRTLCVATTTPAGLGAFLGWLTGSMPESLN